jgi:hypothetical protein
VQVFWVCHLFQIDIRDRSFLSDAACWAHGRFHIIIIQSFLLDTDRKFTKYQPQLMMIGIFSLFRACQVAKQAFDEAATEINSGGEGAYKDSTVMMRLLKDNLALWTSELTGGKCILINILFNNWLLWILLQSNLHFSL